MRLILSPHLVCYLYRFIRLLDGDDKIVEYNQEQARVKSFDGKSSLIRSFP